MSTTALATTNTTPGTAMSARLFSPSTVHTTSQNDTRNPAPARMDAYERTIRYALVICASSPGYMSSSCNTQATSKK